MKKVYIIIALTITCITLYAQYPQVFTGGNMSNSVVSGSLSVHKSESARKALDRIKSKPSSQKFNGYRIGIFFDNSENARVNATLADSMFKANFRGINSYMKYESPYYKVTVGDCLNEEEAVILFERVKAYFPNAYLLREQMELKDLIVKPLEEEEDSTIII